MATWTNDELERLRSENTPHRPMITHTIDSYQIPSQKIWEECKQNCRFFFFNVKAKKLEKFAVIICGKYGNNRSRAENVTELKTLQNWKRYDFYSQGRMILKI